MGRQYEDGYSADVEGFLVVGSSRFRLAKTNGCTLVLAESCELAPGTAGEIVLVIDGNASSRLVVLPDGVPKGQNVASYTVTAPF